MSSKNVNFLQLVNISCKGPNHLIDRLYFSLPVTNHYNKLVYHNLFKPHKPMLENNSTSNGASHLSSNSSGNYELPYLEKTLE
jgi:hypothetical protein